MKGKIISILLIFAALFLTHCANMVAPTGGPKDTTPPKVTEAVPANHSTNFDGRKLAITFDEYVTLNNASQQVLFSPPLNEKPDIKLHNKTLVIKFKEALLPNTTYTIHFGEAVKDLHEGNTFKDYIYSFSTGEVLDTLNLSGTVLDAETRKATADLFVALYDGGCDSLYYQPTRRAPDYITKTDKDGKFQFHGLPNRQFLIFALNDMNSNLYYDLPNETVSFLGTLIVPSDSLNYTLYSFTEVDSTQMLLEKKLIEDGLLRFVFRHPARQLTVEPAGALADSFQLVEVWSKEHDTLCWYFTPGVMDSLRVEINSEDTLINSSDLFDLHFKGGTKPRNERAARAAKTIKVSNNLKNNLLMPGEDFILRFPEPIVDIRMHDTSTLIVNSDTLYNAMTFEQVDEFGKEFRLTTPIEDTMNYVLNMTDSVFYTVRNRTHDAFSVKFQRASDQDLGNIMITVCPPEGLQVVVQLLDNKGKELESRMIDTVAKVEFLQLIPEKYQLRAIFDEDRNGKWSTGNFHKRFLPETVADYKDVLEVKKGWDIDLDDPWILKK